MQRSLILPTAASKPWIKAIALLVTLAGLAVILGWILDIGWLKSLSAAWVSMKFSTALAFVLSGIALYFSARASEGEFEKAQVALSITSLTLALLMGLMFFSALFDMSTGIEELFLKNPNSIRTVVPGRPSIPTMLCFLLMALAGILTILDPVQRPPKLRIIGVTITAIGVLALTGYLFGAPLLYYYMKDLNTAMALHTALLFVLLGTGLICL